MKTFSNILDSSARRLASVATTAIALCACSALVSCSDDSDIISSLTDNEGCFITVEVPMLDAKSRAAGDEDTFNEFTVKTLDLFFYKTQNNDPAVYHKRITDTFVGSKQIEVNIPKNDLTTIFGNGTSCYLYAVANYPQKINEKATPAQLLTLSLGEDFKETKKQESFAMISDAAAEVTLSADKKTASGNVTLTRACAKLMLSLKIPESIEVTNTTEDPGSGTTSTTTVKYIPNPKSARVWITNGVHSSNIHTIVTDSTKIDSNYYYSNTIGDATDGNGIGFTNAQSEGYNWVQSVPFYSYPNKWNPKSAEGVTTITFQIPWHIEGETNQTVTYYSITVNPDNYRLLRNNFYDMRLTVGRLGSVDVKKPINMKVEWNYELPWKEHTLDTNIKDVRYLLLNNNDYDDTNKYPVIGDNLTDTTNLPTETGWYVYKMNNETKIKIPVSTSHKVKIDKVEMIWRDFANNKNVVYQPTYSSSIMDTTYTSTTNYTETTTPGVSYLGVDFDMTTSTLNVTRDLYNVNPNKANGQSKPTYTPMYINVYISHEDNPAYNKKIRIEQYPPIYISSNLTEYSNGFVNTRFINGSKGKANDHTYYTTIFTDYPLNIGSIGNRESDLGISEDVNNLQSYVISISKLDESDKYNDETDYIIADPRLLSPNNFLYTNSNYNNWNWSSEGVDIKDGSKRQIQIYYPTDANNSKENYIAPKFRVASKSGTTLNMTFENAQRRCASYQENGRPAGRWRVPTPAEIKFMATLSCKKFIPYLFGNDSSNKTPKYWSSSGCVQVTNDKANPTVELITDTSDHAVRCVYDEWYWGNDTLVDVNQPNPNKYPLKTEFVWGDRERTTSGNISKSIKR